MDSVRDYLVSIVAVTLICSAVSGLLQNSAAKGLVKILSGMVLTMSIAAPLWKIDISIPNLSSTQLFDQMNEAVSEGEKISRTSLHQVIKEHTEAYILNKARDLNVPVSVEVILSKEDPPVPQGAVISGKVTPYAKKQLQEILEKELAITKENQEWTG